jgi:hypothetical protein
MGWAEIVGRMPAKLLVITGSLAAAAFSLLVAATLLSLYVTKEPFEIAGLGFGPKHPIVFSAPPNAVVAFAIEADKNDPKKQCPAGWTAFEPVRGRFIIGAGVPANSDFRDWIQQDTGKPVPLSTYGLLQAGGEEVHVLTVGEIPPHSHTVFSVETTAGDGHFPSATAMGGNNPHEASQTSVAGGGQPHNNLPPYLALYYCQKEQ